ncbi:MAG TPA: T9SS type A sorting domain-containing protein [Cytophagales bacterium]|nr:T9SS type A sorting domain-containing protein [Cytophagales bacterium]
MKKILLNTISLALLATGYSQITITKQLFDQYNDTTLSFSVTNVDQVNIGTNAADGTWDVSNAIIDTPEVSIIKPYDASLPGAANFPNATHCSDMLTINEDGSLSSSNNLGYVVLSNTNYDILGTYGSQEAQGMQATMTTKYNPARKALSFPFNYQNQLQYTTTQTTSSPSMPSNIVTDVEGTMVYEGWGKVKFPKDNNYTPVARLHHVETFTTVTTQGAGGFEIKMSMIMQIDQTDFISENFKAFSHVKTTTITKTEMPFSEPMEDTTVTTSGIFSKGTSRAEIRDIALSLNDDKYFTGVKVFPNPTAESVSFNSTLKVVSVEVISSNGSSYIADHVDNTVAINGEKGLYLVKLTLENGASKSFKVVKN